MGITELVAFAATWVLSTGIGMVIGAEIIRREIDGLKIEVGFSPGTNDEERN